LHTLIATATMRHNSARNPDLLGFGLCCLISVPEKNGV
jgi:hypothetical protein